jgi:DNA-binding transcriptional ArsR family regulator
MAPIKNQMGTRGPTGAGSAQGWTFLSNHGHVLVCLAGDPSMRVREVALRVGISERAVQRIVGELTEAGYVRRTRKGRRNRYRVLGDLPLRHPVEAHRRVGDLVAAVGAPPSGTAWAAPDVREGSRKG